MSGLQPKPVKRGDLPHGAVRRTALSRCAGRQLDHPGVGRDDGHQVKQGDLVGSKYRLRTRLGQGGMGVVWSAAHVQTGREFAIKFLHPVVAAASELIAPECVLMVAAITAAMIRPTSPGGIRSMMNVGKI